MLAIQRDINSFTCITCACSKFNILTALSNFVLAYLPRSGLMPWSKTSNPNFDDVKVKKMKWTTVLSLGEPTFVSGNLVSRNRNRVWEAAEKQKRNRKEGPVESLHQSVEVVALSVARRSPQIICLAGRLKLAMIGLILGDWVTEHVQSTVQHIAGKQVSKLRKQF